jgi:hypothetical protein
MKNKHEFYPMITGTMKTLLCLTEFGNEWDYLNIILNYPNYKLDENLENKPLAQAIINELDRQYERWDKGGKNGKQ